MAHPLRIDLIARPVGALRRGDGMVIAERTYVAEGALSRLVGMLGSASIAWWMISGIESLLDRSGESSTDRPS